ncbi:hypothetical protein ACOSQ2_003858 [Xanthoceras sorbifolium]
MAELSTSRLNFIQFVKLRRKVKSRCCSVNQIFTKSLTSFSILPNCLCLLLVVAQTLLDHVMKNISVNICGSGMDQAANPMLQIPAPEYRAVRTNLVTVSYLPNESCKRNGSCPVTMLLIGNNHSLGQISSKNMFVSTFNVNSSDVMDNLASNGSDESLGNFPDPAFYPNLSILSSSKSLHLRCVQGLNLWRNSSSEINDELYKAYDLLNSDANHFNSNTGNGPTRLMHVPRSINLVSNFYLQFLKGPDTQMLFLSKKFPGPKSICHLFLAHCSLRGLIMITYAYFLTISLIYILCFVVFGSIIGLKFFTLNDYAIQFVFYFIFINLQISLAFLVAALFSNVKTASVMEYIFVFGSGLLGDFLFQPFVQDASFPRVWIVIMELYPGFALCYGLYEFGQYSFRDQVVSSRGVKGPLCFLQKVWKMWHSSLQGPSLRRQGFEVLVQTNKPDAVQEGEKVEQLLLEPITSHAIICADIRSIQERMMIGLTKQTSGTTFVQGLDIRTDMDRIHTSIGWEHLLFYGRLKNLKGFAFTQAVEESLKSLNLFHGGVASKQLSVVISLIGDPKVVYMDEPSTVLDPASRNNLWNIVKLAKQGRTIILTRIFVDGSLQCIGNPKELKARYGGSYVFTMITSANHEKEMEDMVHSLSPNANKIYQKSGTQKFELPKLRIADVFQAVDYAKSMFEVFAWGLADTTLEDVFIKVARSAQAFNSLP